MRKEGEGCRTDNKEGILFSWKQKDVQRNNISARLYRYY